MPEQTTGGAECVRCSAGQYGTQALRASAADSSARSTCTPCGPNMLQPHVGQTSCLPHPEEGVDNTVQDAVQILPGWFRPSESRLSEGEGRFNISLVVTVADGDFEADAFEGLLIGHLQCEQPTCRVSLTVGTATGSTTRRVHAAVVDDASATPSAAVRLMSLSGAELYSVLGVAVEGAVVVVGAGTLQLPTPENLAPVLCPMRDSCLGGRNRSDCRDGHTGLLCGTCEEGYYRRKGGCASCDGHAGPSVALFASGLAAALGMALLFMVVSYRKSSSSDAEDDGAFQRTALTERLSSAQAQLGARCAVRTLLGKLVHRARALGSIGKILLAYFQVLNTFSQLPSIRWPANFESYLDASAPLAFELFSTYPLGCLVDGADITFTHELIGVLLLPLVGTVAVLVLALAAAQCTLPKGERGLRTVATRPETCTMQLWLLLLLYPSLAKTALVPFDCVDVGGRSLLRANPAVGCDGDDWLVLGALGGIGTILYAFGFPALCFLVTRASHREHAALAAKQEDGSSLELSELTWSRVELAPSEGGAGEETNRAQVVMRLHFERAKLLLRSYHERYWYWESLEVLRKYLLTSVVLVVAHDTLLQARPRPAAFGFSFVAHTARPRLSHRAPRLAGLLRHDDVCCLRAARGTPPAVR